MSESAAPPRKRRRPALSCEICRRRKIKCDRNYPCSQCLQSKTATCSYSPDSIPLTAGHMTSPKSSTDNHSSVTISTRGRNLFNLLEGSNLASSYDESPKIFAVADKIQTSSASPPSTRTIPQPQELPLHHIHEKLARLKDPQDLQDKTLECNKHSSIHSVDDFQQSSIPLSDDFRLSKTRYFGRSHWLLSFGLFERISEILLNPENNTPHFDELGTSADIKPLLESCKALARQAKSETHAQWVTNPTFRDSVPPREICDQLVNHYLRTSEGIYRILHVPSFKREYNQYWEKPAAASPVVIFKILLVMAIGVCFYQGPDNEYYRAEAKKWILAVQAWLASPLEKGRLHMSAIQIHCLLLIARYNNAISDDLIFISAGSLLRVAFTMGYHRDPKHLIKMPALQAEMRRRLWATLLELNVQSSLDAGQPVLISPDDYDTEAPSNINDTDINETTTQTPAPKPSSTYTDCSLQLRLLSTLATRLRITSILNSFKPTPSYDEIIALSSHLIKSCKENKSFITQTNKTPPTISHLHQNILDLSIRRFLLGIHRPFNVKADTEPKFYFSQKVCIESAMIMLSYPSTPNSTSPEIEDDYTSFCLRSGGFFKSLVVHCTMTVFSELLRSLEEEDSLPSHIIAVTREPFKRVLRDASELARRRIGKAEYNVKGYVFTSVVLAQIEAMERIKGGGSERVDMVGVEVARRCLRVAEEILRERAPRGRKRGREGGGVASSGARVAGAADADGSSGFGAADASAEELGSSELRKGNGLGGGNLPTPINTTSSSSPSASNPNTTTGPETPDPNPAQAGEFMQDWNMDFDMPDPDSWLSPALVESDQYTAPPWWFQQFESILP